MEHLEMELHLLQQEKDLSQDLGDTGKPFKNGSSMQASI